MIYFKNSDHGLHINYESTQLFPSTSKMPCPGNWIKFPLLSALKFVLEGWRILQYTPEFREREGGMRYQRKYMSYLWKLAAMAFIYFKAQSVSALQIARQIQNGFEV